MGEGQPFNARKVSDGQFTEYDIDVDASGNDMNVFEYYEIRLNNIKGKRRDTDCNKFFRKGQKSTEQNIHKHTK